MANYKLLTILKSDCLLGEGAYYSQQYRCVFWVDIKGARLFSCDQDGASLTSYLMPESLCWVRDHADGGLVAGFASGVYLIRPPFNTREIIWENQHEPASNRLNDAAVDRRGQLYFGTMDNNEKARSGCLYSMVNGKPYRVDGHYIVSNGPAVSVDNKTLYSTSSTDRTIYRFTRSSCGLLKEKTPHIRFTEQQGYPDGMTVDSDNHLWVAGWDGNGVFRFNPLGECVLFIPLPARQVTSVAFVGNNLQTLAVTTAKIGLSSQVLSAYPESGHTFLLHTAFTGLPEVPAVL